jgi:thiosulfate dehydrogenase [quinone] large subunit
MTMSVIHRHRHEATTAPVVAQAGAPAIESHDHGTLFDKALATLRIAFGITFLWAFLDKAFALGFHTGYDQEGNLDRFGPAAWINGGSPTEGFLANAPTGPFADFYKDIAGATWADWMFMAGLAGIGIALVLGVAMRIAAVSGALLLVMMWTAVLPPENNPVIDDHIVYALVLGVLALASANKTLGLGRVWERIPLVARYGFLK